MTRAFPNGDRSADERPKRNPIIPDAIAVPPEILARHRARVLDSATAVRTSDGERPLSTVYRADTLLVPARDVRELLPIPENNENEVNKTLGELGLALSPSAEDGYQDDIGKLPGDLGVPVPLVSRPEQVTDRAPDPWAALMLLRSRLGRRVAGYGLDHLMMSASLAVTGAPVSNGGSVGGMPVSNGGSVGGGEFALYTGSRNPVALLMPQPVRPPRSALAGNRRPVVAVLDTGIGRHPWWDDQDPNDPIIEVSPEFQALLAALEQNQSVAEPAPLSTPYEEDDLLQPLLGLLDSHAGHGTFVSGLVHQLCPAATVLSLRVLHTDGFSTEGALLLALNWLAERVESGDPDKRVDVVSMSLGFYPESTDPAKVAQVRAVIERLTAQGVLVVSAAGNDATLRPFLPAAFARGTGVAAGGVELLSAIGARNAPGLTTAAFSNWGEWVTRWAPGDAVVSTVPVNFQGSGRGGLELPDAGGPWLRTTSDPDDLRSGFAVWAGTSFATPVVAGLLAQSLGVDQTKGDGVGRAQRALIATDAELVRRGWQ